MKAINSLSLYDRRSLRRARWFVFVVASALVVLGEVYSYFELGISLFAAVINLLIGFFIALLMTELGFRYVSRLQDDFRQAVASLEAAETQLHWQSAALASAANAIVITDENGRITWINPAFIQLTGYLPDEVIGGLPSVLKSGQQDNAFYGQLWQTILAGEVWRGELVNRRKDGSLYTEEQTITPVLDEQGRVSRFIAIKQDVTRRKTMQEAEREERILAEALRDAGMALSATLDLDEVMDILLDQIGRVVPYDTVSLMRVGNGRAVIVRARGNAPFPKRFVEPENVVFVIEETPNLLDLVQSRQAVIVPDTEKHPGWIRTEAGAHIRCWMGVPIMIEGEVFALLSLDKREPGFYLPKHVRILSAFAVQASLILHNARLFAEKEENLRREQQINRVVQATNATLDLPHVLKQVVELAASLVEADGAAMALVEADGQMMTFPYLFHMPESLEWRPAPQGRGLAWRVVESRQAVRLASYSDHPDALPEWKGAGVCGFLAVPIVAGEVCLGVLGLFLFAPEKAFSERDQALAELVGRQTGVAIQNARLFAETRQRAGELDSLNRMMEKRITDRTRELAEANEQLQQLDRLKSKFVSDVSHELRTPITNLTMYLDLLERGRAEKRAHYVTILQKETARIRQLVEDILDLSRLDASREQGIHFVPVDLNQIVSQVVLAQMPQVKAAGLQLTFEPETRLPLVWGAQYQLTQVVTNLLTNAANYTPAGSIEVKTYQENGEVCLLVRDTGMGIDPIDMPHIFDRFYRGQRVAQLGVPGTGLGLGIVKEIVELHGGRVEAASEVGQGSVFRVWLAAAENKS